VGVLDLLRFHPPTLTFDPALPISGAVEEIRAALAAHQVVVVAGETGSGKTTQLPKIALAAGRTRIAHTQPRRIAARSVATRIAAEMGVELGDGGRLPGAVHPAGRQGRPRSS
jgi:ATP-dependent helicase HrpA